MGGGGGGGGGGPPPPPRRRIILAAPAALLLLPPPRIAEAAAETPAEALRLLSGRAVPGLGPPDVYYPPYFAGRWRVTRVISDSDDDFWLGMKRNGVGLPVRVVSEMRFVPRDSGRDFVVVGSGGGKGGDDADDPGDPVPVVADRSFNERSYYAALSDELDRLFSAMKKFPPIRSSDWTPADPNVLSLTYADGSSREIKVTKRSSDVGRDGEGLFSSEFRRITDVPPSSPGGIGGIPRIYKSRVLTKWKRGSVGAASGGEGVNLIEGIEIVYNEQGTLGNKNVDPLLGGGGGRNGAIPSLYGNDTKDLPDWRSTKTNILMERII